MPHIKPDDLRQIGYQLFEATGCPPESARAVVDHLVESSLYGHDSHGSIRIYEYVGQILEGIFDPKGQPSIISDKPCAVVVDGGVRAEHELRARLERPRVAVRLGARRRTVTRTRCSDVRQDRVGFDLRFPASGLRSA